MWLFGRSSVDVDKIGNVRSAGFLHARNGSTKFLLGATEHQVFQWAPRRLVKDSKCQLLTAFTSSSNLNLEILILCISLEMPVLKDGLGNAQKHVKKRKDATPPNILLGNNLIREAANDIKSIFQEFLGGFRSKMIAALPSTDSCGCCAVWVPGDCVFNSYRPTNSSSIIHWHICSSHDLSYLFVSHAHIRSI